MAAHFFAWARSLVTIVPGVSRDSDVRVNNNCLAQTLPLKKNNQTAFSLGLTTNMLFYREP